MKSSRKNRLVSFLAVSALLAAPATVKPVSGKVVVVVGGVGVIAAVIGIAKLKNYLFLQKLEKEVTQPAYLPGQEPRFCSWATKQGNAKTAGEINENILTNDDDPKALKDLVRYLSSFAGAKLQDRSMNTKKLKDALDAEKLWLLDQYRALEGMANGYFGWSGINKIVETAYEQCEVDPTILLINAESEVDRAVNQLIDDASGLSNYKYAMRVSWKVSKAIRRLDALRAAVDKYQKTRKDEKIDHKNTKNYNIAVNNPQQQLPYQ